MRIGSLCTGYAGIDSVFDGDLAWYCEIDKGPLTLLPQLHPEAKSLGDLKLVDWSTVEPINVLTAGFPCQPVSDAGRKLIHDDPRWLWPDVFRAVRTLRPEVVFLENVAALLKRGFPGILGDLASIGFDAEWGTIRASDVGAPHQRNRLFILAWPADAPGVGVEGRRSGDAAGAHGHPDSANLAAAHDAGFDWPEEYLPALRRWELVTGRTMPHPVNHEGTRGKSLVGRVATEFVEFMMGLPEGHVTGRGLSRSAELKLLGNGVVPQQAMAAYEELARRSR